MPGCSIDPNSVSMRHRSLISFALFSTLLSVTTTACAVSEDEERALGAEAAAQVDREMPFVADPDINAFALPGGFVYVNRGLIERAGTASELAGVLGHEIGHVVLRHSAERIEKAQKTNVGVSVVCGLTNLCSSEAARVAINVGGAALFARFSRQDEFEADSAAVGITTRAGFDPNGIATMFSKLLRERERQPDIVSGWFGSHPLEEDRIAAVQRIIAASPRPDGARLRSDDEAFRAIQARVRALPPPPPPRAIPSAP